MRNDGRRGGCGYRGLLPLCGSSIHRSGHQHRSPDKYGILTSFDEFIQANKRNKDLKIDDMYHLRERMTLAQTIGASGDSSAEVKAGDERMTNLYIRGVSPSMINIDTVRLKPAAMSMNRTTSTSDS